MNNKYYYLRFPAHDELGACRTSLVYPKLSVLRISIGSTDLAVLTITQRNIIDTGPGAARWARPLDFTKQKLLRHSIIGRPEGLTNCDCNSTNNIESSDDVNAPLPPVILLCLW